MSGDWKKIEMLVTFTKYDALFQHTCFPTAGNHSKAVAKTLRDDILPKLSPSAPHLHTSLSSLTDSNWQSGDQATDVAISVSK
jgi:hypothetical protein